MNSLNNTALFKGQYIKWIIHFLKYTSKKSMYTQASVAPNLYSFYFYFLKLIFFSFGYLDAIEWHSADLSFNNDTHDIEYEA